MQMAFGNNLDFLERKVTEFPQNSDDQIHRSIPSIGLRAEGLDIYLFCGRKPLYEMRRLKHLYFLLVSLNALGFFHYADMLPTAQQAFLHLYLVNSHLIFRFQLKCLVLYFTQCLYSTQMPRPLLKCLAITFLNDSFA